ncbi:FeoB-associated Cys-rich membrane protein [Listeria rocourtiae]|nr:FeoB-associated Cys-rich membrane protein [Listeria rocourtiae]MBC1435651.1 FeoB-associated Cys-rich membrane protein [Listeria rocourtiae]
MLSLLINILIGSLIFGYAAYALIRHIKKSKSGKCSGCHLEKSCAAHEKSN